MNDNNNQNIHNQISQSKGDGLPDIRKITRLVISNWYLFAISLPICVASIFIFHRYTQNVYRGSVTVMLKSDEPKSISRAELIEGFGLSPEMKSLENQTIILRSKKVVRRAIDLLDFGIDIYSDGFLMDYDMYNRSPFSVVMDSSHVQILNTPIHIKPQDNDKVNISIQCDNAVLHTFKDGTNHGGSGTISFNQTVNWGDEISTPYGKFTLIKHQNSINPEVGYYFYFRSHDWLTNTYRSNITVSPYKEGSSIIYISTTGTNTSKIISFLNALSKVYLEQSLERKNEIATRTISFIDTQLTQVSDSLRAAQEKLMNFRRSNIFSAPSEITARLADQYFEYEKELNLVKIREEYYNNLSAHLIEDPYSEDFLLPAFTDDANGIISGFITELLAQINEHTLTTAKSSEINPYLDELEKRIEVSRQNLLVALKKLLQNIEIEKQKLNNQLKELSQKMNQLPEIERKYIDIERGYKLNDAIFTFLLQKQSETQITKASNTPDNEIIDEAGITSIVAPNKKKNTQQALMLAFALPIAIIVLKEYLNNKIRDKQDVIATCSSIPILGYISQYKGNESNVIHGEPLSNISESFRALRTKLKFMCPNDEAHIITITSTNTGEGKTFCALNLASAFAISGKKTVLVGFDLRKPRLTEIFSHHNHLGLSNFLIGQATTEQIIYEGDVDNLCIIPSGAIPPNPSELIATKHTPKLFEDLKKRFDVIIVDSPPIGVVADSRILMEFSSCQLFVIRSAKTEKEHFKHTIQNLISEGIGGIGFILNDLANNISGHYYYADRYYAENKK
ncbi:GumC family protein [Plebeiibacterium marinum]|uniref:non-specific protein-tyrosine kinase n=1 Tax=Plebeiibacterium marinum TaxID=2992111 RepID=A0AAE3MIA7_9BACT|nr:tyrosine-protein kinase [Plebeiobacterium marinum]MCW3807602.1 polysaccharide biosynthesis tyrosine autokinase [Plebeiobacterium marinum]